MITLETIETLEALEEVAKCGVYLQLIVTAFLVPGFNCSFCRWFLGQT